MTDPKAMEPLFADSLSSGPQEAPVARWIPPARSDEPQQMPAVQYGDDPRFAPQVRVAAPYVPSEIVEEDPVTEYSTAPSAAALMDDDQPPMVPLAEREQQLAKLGYLCEWLREARQPLCPLNGAIALLPLNTIEAGPREVVELQRAVKGDLAAVQDALKLRFPVTALAVGLEEDSGFEELMRRAGQERAQTQPLWPSLRCSRRGHATTTYRAVRADQRRL